MFLKTVTTNITNNIIQCEQQLDVRSSVKHNNYTFDDMINRCDNRNNVYYHNVMSQVISLIQVKKYMIIIMDDNILLLDYLNRLYSDKTSIYTIKTDYNMATMLKTVFQEINIKDELYFICIGSFDFATTILKLAHQMDDSLGQQGYFTHLHKYVFINIPFVPCSAEFLEHVGEIDNVLCVMANRNEDDYSIELYTAMYENSRGYWDIISNQYTQNFFNSDGLSKDLFPNSQFKLNNKHERMGTHV